MLFRCYRNSDPTIEGNISAALLILPSLLLSFNYFYIHSHLLHSFISLFDLQVSSRRAEELMS